MLAILCLLSSVGCNLPSLVNQYKNLPYRPPKISCPEHINRGIGSIINHILIRTIREGAFPDFSACQWVYGCNSSELFGTGGFRPAPPTSCSRAEILTAAATALLDQHIPPTGRPHDVAVHIRNGDKLKSESRDLAPMTRNATWWLKFIKPIVHGSTFIASDDCTIAHQVASHFNSVEVRCEAPNGHFGRTVYTCSQAVQFLQDLWIMARAKVFVGSLKSNIPRLVAKLRGFDNNIVAVPGTGHMRTDWMWDND